MLQKNKKVILVILDGWGVAKPSRGNIIYQANTPTINIIEKSYFAVSLQASGIGVGLPWGRKGNSEVGHINLGAGKIIYQYLPRIITAIRDGSFFKNKALLGAVKFVQRNNSTLHIMGLISSGSVHSYIDHLYALLDLAKQHSLDKVVLHIFTDGKDSYPNEALKFIQNLEIRIKKQKLASIGSIIGRAYAMDRNNKWDLTQKTYDLIVNGKGIKIKNPTQFLKKSYQAGQTDFDIEPAVVIKNGSPVGLIKKGDALIFFNFREDSARQITKAFVLSDEEFNYFPRKKISNLYFVGMTKYQDNLPIEVAFQPPIITNPLTNILSNLGKTQLHIAETEKYAHITFFFNGENEIAYAGEKRILIPSIGTPHYENVPEMQAYNITQKLLENIESYDFFLINYANADMLAHTGNIEATIRGVEIIDANMSSLLEAAKNMDITLIITSDHGNAEEMIELKTGRIKTSHSINPVPLYIVDKNYTSKNYKPLYEQEPMGVLADVAPTILKIMGIPIPKEMTGHPLI